MQRMGNCVRRCRPAYKRKGSMQFLTSTLVVNNAGSDLLFHTAGERSETAQGNKAHAAHGKLCAPVPAGVQKERVDAISHIDPRRK